MSSAGSVRSPAYRSSLVPSARATDVFFNDGDFAWIEPPGGSTVALAATPVPALPTLPAQPRRRKPPRTLAGDLRVLRAALAESASVSNGASALAALLLALALLLLGLAANRTGVWPRFPDEAAPTRPRAQAPPESTSSEPASIAPRAAVARPLEVGSVGSAVLGAQQALAVLGLSDALPDGEYGDGTAAVVRAFEVDAGLTADGVLGTATADAVRRALAEAARIDADEAIAGVAVAAAAGRLPVAAAREDARVAERAVDAVAALPLDRAAYVAGVLDTIAAHRDVYDAPRAIALFGMLEANVEHLAAAPPKKRDAVDADGVSHRFFAARGFQFHPLSSFVRLNAATKEKRTDDAARLAAAMVARGIKKGDALLWEYYFPFGGPSRWVSGLAQAVGAQSLARAAALTGDRRLSRAATAAFAAIPATLSRPLADGIWVREYGYSDSAILNAQLQTIVSLSEYARITGDQEAARFVARLTTAARTLLPRFDTGCWSLYMLAGSPASLAYHTYHVSLLRRLAKETGEEIWATTAERWAGYRRAGGCS